MFEFEFVAGRSWEHTHIVQARGVTRSRVLICMCCLLGARLALFVPGCVGLALGAPPGQTALIVAGTASRFERSLLA